MKIQIISYLSVRDFAFEIERALFEKQKRLAFACARNTVSNSPPFIGSAFDLVAVIADRHLPFSRDIRITGHLAGVRQSAGVLGLVTPATLPAEEIRNLHVLLRWAVKHNIDYHVFVAEFDGRRLARASRRQAPEELVIQSLHSIGKELNAGWSLQISQCATPELAALSAMRMGPREELPYSAPCAHIISACDDRHGIVRCYEDVFKRMGLSMLGENVRRSAGGIAVCTFVVAPTNPEGSAKLSGDPIRPLEVNLQELKDNIESAFRTRSGNSILELLDVRDLGFLTPSDIYKQGRRGNAVNVTAVCEDTVGAQNVLMELIASTGCTANFAGVQSYLDKQGKAMNDIRITYDQASLPRADQRRLQDTLRRTDTPFMGAPSVTTSSRKHSRSPRRRPVNPEMHVDVVEASK